LQMICSPGRTDDLLTFGLMVAAAGRRLEMCDTPETVTARIRHNTDTGR
jgi:hypothetical protein